MSGSMLKQVFNNKGNSPTKNIDSEEKQLDKEIQSLQQKKAALNKEIDNIKNDFAPPKPKDQLIRPIKDQIQTLDAEIQQKQMEKTKKQSEKTKEASNSDGDKKSNFVAKDIEGNHNPDSIEEKNKSDLELLKNFTTQTGVINEAKIKSTSKNSDVLLLKENPYSDTSDSIKSISEKKRKKYVKDAIDTYKLMDNSDLVNSEKNILE